MTSRTSREPLVLAGALALGFVALTVWVKFEGPIPGDARLWAWAQAHPPAAETVSNLLQFFATFGSPLVAGSTVLVTAAVVARNVGAEAAGFVLAAAAGALIEPAVASLVGLTDAALEVGVPEGGHPSGHTLFAATSLGAVACAGWRFGRREVAVIAVALVAAMGVVRSVDRSHLLSEVLGGYLLGGAWLLLVLASPIGARLRR